MSEHRHVDRRFGHVYRYHSRSDAHSIALCTFVLEDLLHACPALSEQVRRGKIIYGTNINYTWRSTGKAKTLDLAIGPPSGRPEESPLPSGTGVPSEILVSCEAKSVMTEHGKSQPRVYDELSSSHEIVHQGRQDAIATGITVVNIADTFVSPLRQTSSETLYVTRHNQPAAAASMVLHLRGLPIRNAVGEVGFDAYTTIVVDCDNQGDVRLWTGSPAPQSGDPDHYEAFLGRISQFYSERFSATPAR